jgi:hypothetical protein
MTTKTDGNAMEVALIAIRAARLPFRKTDPYQIKHGRFNFYPNRGTIYRDGDPNKLEERGVEAFIRLCGYPKEGIASIVI